MPKLSHYLLAAPSPQLRRIPSILSDELATVRVMKCEAGGCISTDVNEVTYTDTFRDDTPTKGWVCAEHAAVLRKRDLAAMGLRYLKTWQAAQEALRAFDADRLLIAGPSGDPHLAALDRFLQVHQRIAAELDAAGGSEVKGLVAAADEQMVERIERMLTLAMRLRDEQARGRDGD
jgi:hypothetical protein